MFPERMESNTMHAEAHSTTHPMTAVLQDCLRRQRQAYLAHPVPTLAERWADLRTLARFVHENKAAFTTPPSGNAGARIACGVIEGTAGTPSTAPGTAPAPKAETPSAPAPPPTH